MHNVLLPESVQALGTAEFPAVFKKEFQSLKAHQLPLQQALRQSSSVSGSPFSILILHHNSDATTLQVKVAVMFKGLISGCHCVDDPTPMEEENEYCELQVNIDKATAIASIELLPS